jgi:hypothetical protein
MIPLMHQLTVSVCPDGTHGAHFEAVLDDGLIAIGVVNELDEYEVEPEATLRTLSARQEGERGQLSRALRQVSVYGEALEEVIAEMESQSGDDNGAVYGQYL